MRLKITKSKNASSFYVIKDVNRNGKRTTKIGETLGTLEKLKKKQMEKILLNGQKNIFKN